MGKRKNATAGTDIAARTRELIDALTLNDIRLLEGAMKLAVKDGPLPEKSELTIELKADVNKARKLLRVCPSFKLEVRYDDAKSDPAVLIAARFQMIYGISSLEAMKKDAVSGFAERVCLFAIWPYWREYVNSMTSRMGLPTLTVPMLTSAVLSESQRRNSPLTLRKTKRKT